MFYVQLKTKHSSLQILRSKFNVFKNTVISHGNNRRTCFVINMLFLGINVGIKMIKIVQNDRIRSQLLLHFTNS